MKLKSRLPNADGTTGLLSAMTNELQTEAASSTKSNGERVLAAWLTEENSKTCLTWCKANSNCSHAVKEHASFSAILNACSGRICCCSDRSIPCPVHDGGKSIALSDLVWILADMIFEHIPSAVPHTALATLVKVAQCKGLFDINTPGHCHFLGVFETRTQTQDGIGRTADFGEFEFESESKSEFDDLFDYCQLLCEICLRVRVRVYNFY